MKWRWCKISDIFEVARGGSPRPIQNYLTDDPDGLNWIMIGDASEGAKYITSTKNRIKPDGLKKTRMVHEGDFLLTNSMSFGRPYILKTSGCIHDGWLVLSPKSEAVFPDFFYYLFGSKTLYDEFSKRASGAVVKNLNTSLVKQVPIPLPPLADQKRIAGILDAADALRAKRREALAHLDTLLQSTFLDMFGDPVTNPMGWEECVLGDVCIDKPAYGSGAAACEFDPSLPRYVRITDVDDSGELSDDPKSAKMNADEIEKYKLEKGDVLFARSGATVGKSYLHRNRNGSCVYAGYMIRFRPDPKRLLSETLFRHTQTAAYWRWVGSQARVVAQPNINAKMYSALPILVPPLDLQRRFAAIVETIEQQKARMHAHLAELEALFASLQCRAFNGDL